MSRREDIDNAIWSDPDFEALSLAGTVLYFWSWTNPRCGMAGIYKVSARAMTESKVTADRIEATLAELAAAQFAFYEVGVLFVRTRVKHLRQKTPQIATSIRNDLAKIADDHPLKAMWMREYASHSWLEIDGLPTLTRPSTEGRAVGSLEPKSGGSREPHPRLKGNGKGKGTGKGPLGRGAGREEPPSRRDQFQQMVDREFPGVPFEAVQLAMAHLRETTGSNPDTERVRRQLADDGYIDQRSAA